MKRPLIITIGILVVLLVLGIWAYLLFFGTPQNVKEVPANLGFDFTPQEVRVVEEVEDNEYKVDTSSGLQQLTTKPVAGFSSYISTTSSSTMVRYVEQGTGHIYDINIETGEETIASRTTIPRIREATFSPTAKSVALTAIEGNSKNTFFGTIDYKNKSLEGENIVPNAENIGIPEEGIINYTKTNDDGLTGYSYDLLNGEQSEVFLLPFKDIEVLWGDTKNYFYNQPDSSLPGYLYEMGNGSYNTTDISGYGLVANGNQSYFGYSKKNNEGEYISEFVKNDSKERYPSPVLLIPEKCDYSNSDENKLWCAAAIDTSDFDLSDWYKGKTSSNDMIWEININDSSAVLINQLEENSGRSVDVKNIKIGGDDNLILFTNKIDNTLWKLDI